jgi:cytochrome P450 family 135
MTAAATKGPPATAPTRLPPGPTAAPIAQTVAFHRDPLGVLRRARTRHGPLFTLRLAVAGPVVVACDVAAIEPLLQADPDCAHAGEARRRMLPIASPRSLFGADGRQHHAARQRIAAAFDAGVLSRRRDEMAAIAADHAERWPRTRPFRLLPRVRTLIDEIFVRTVLGVEDAEQGRLLALAIRRMLLSPGNPPLPLPGEGNGTLVRPASALFAWRSAPVARLLAEAVDSRRSHARDGDDVIGVLVRSAPELSTGEMVDELLPVIMAAQEPPSVALTWILDRLGRDEALRDRYAAAGEDGFRDAVVRETLRLQPPALAVLRRLTGPVELLGTRLPAGAVAILPIPLLHRDAEAFPAPDEFRAERWTTGAASEGAYLPFGGGRRRCIGEHLAQVYFQAVVPAIARRLRLRPLSRRPERMVVRATTLVPQRSALVTAHSA